MSEMFYAIYSPSKDKWLDANGELGSFKDAEKFTTKDDNTILEGDCRWVGPLVAGDYK